VIGKHRNGPTGRLELVFNAEYTRFDNLASSARRERF
jgi:replicative DNA helicase